MPLAIAEVLQRWMRSKPVRGGGLAGGVSLPVAGFAFGFLLPSVASNRPGLPAAEGDNGSQREEERPRGPAPCLSSS